jgi:hypothetical protein
LVEQRIENPRVGSSILSLGTIRIRPTYAFKVLDAKTVPLCSFLTGMLGDTLEIRASDGTAFGAWSSFAVSVLPTTNKSATHGQVSALSSLFSVSDADNDTITRYQLWDGTADPLSGSST